MSLATERRLGKPINNCSQEPQKLGWELTLSHEKQPHPHAVCEFCWWRCHIDLQPVHLFHINSGMPKSFHASAERSICLFFSLGWDFQLHFEGLLTSDLMTLLPYIIKSSLWERKSAPSNCTYFPLDRSSRETNSSITNFDSKNGEQNCTEPKNHNNSYSSDWSSRQWMGYWYSSEWDWLRKYFSLICSFRSESWRLRKSFS